MQINPKFVLPITLPKDLLLIAGAISGNVKYAVGKFGLTLTDEPDVLQATLVILADPPRVFPTHGQFFKYVNDCAVTAARKLKSQSRKETELNYDVEKEHNQEKYSDAELIQLARAREHLTEELQIVVIKRYEEGKSIAKIALELGLTEKRVTKMLERARSELFWRIMSE